MENICAKFETWTLWDNVYSPFHKGEIANLALNFVFSGIRKTSNSDLFLKQINLCNYSIRAKVICKYTEEDNYKSSIARDNFLVIDTGEYKFFMHSYHRFPYEVGQYIEGLGEVAVDCYMWSEQSYKIDDAPDIRNNFFLDSIVKINIPVELIYQDENACIYPSSLKLSSLNDTELIEIQDMNEAIDEACFMLLYLKKIKKEDCDEKA